VVCDAVHHVAEPVEGLAGARPGLVPAAFPAGAMTGIDPNVLLAAAKVETD